MNEFNRALAKVLVHEGGYSDHPDDPGGATNKGVTQKVYDDYRRGQGRSTQSVRKLTDGELETIYRVRYWGLIKGDSLPPGVSYVVFDGAVNSGVAQSAKWLQRAVGVKADGIIGPGTLAAVNSHHDPVALVDAICDRRLAFLQALKTWKTFGRGWAARVAGVRQIGKAWAGGVQEPRISLVADTDVKARVEDAKRAPTKGFADAATGGGFGSGGMAIALQQVQDQLTPFSSASVLIGKIVAFLIIAGIVLTMGGIAYRWYATRKKAELADELDKVPL